MTNSHKTKLTFFLIATLTILVGAFVFFAQSSGKESRLFTKADAEKQVEQKQTQAPQEPQRQTATITFVGDMMFDRYVRQMATTNGYDKILENLTTTLNKSDLVVGNLEGPITTNESVSITSEIGARNNFLFTFDPQITKTLVKNNIEVVNLGNNHARDFGQDGVEQTKKFLKDADIDFFGDTKDGQANRALIKELNGMKITFVNFNAFTKNAKQNTKDDIEAVKDKTDFLVVFTHWGQEYETLSNDNQKNLARSWIDAGADLVIGTHPHVVQEKEVYQGKTIYYSIGNFIFDQFFSTETKEGLIVKTTFHKEGEEKTITFEDQKVEMKPNGTTVLKE